MAREMVLVCNDEGVSPRLDTCAKQEPQRGHTIQKRNSTNIIRPNGPRYDSPGRSPG